MANEVQKQDRWHSHQHQRWTCKLYLSKCLTGRRKIVCNICNETTVLLERSHRDTWNITEETAHEKGHEGGDSQHTKSGRCCHCVGDAKFHCLLEVKSRHALAGKSFWNFNLWCSDFAGKATKSVYHQQAWSMHKGLYNMIILPRQQVLIAAVFDLVIQAENIIWFGFVERLKLSPKQTHVKETRFKIILMLKWTTLGSNLSYLHWYGLTAYQKMCCIFPVFKYISIV